METKSRNKMSWKVLAALIFCVAILSSGLTYYFVHVTNPTTPQYWTGGVYPGASSYTVWKEGSTYYAKNAYGAIDYSGTDVSTVIQSAHDNLPSEGSFSIQIMPGLYMISVTINVTKSVQFISDGIDTILRLSNGANRAMFNFTMPEAIYHNCGLKGLRLDGNKDEQTGGDYLIYFEDVYDPIVWRCWIYRAYRTGLYFGNVEKPIVEQNWIEDCTKTGQTGYALYFSGTTRFARACSNVFYDNYQDLRVGNDVVRATIESNSFTTSDVGNVDLSGSVISFQHNLFSNPIAVDNTWSCVKVYGTAGKSASKIEICNNIGTAASSYRPKRFVYVDNYSEDVMVKDNVFKDYGTAFIYIHPSAVNIKVKSNIGFITENSGTATITASTSVTFNHGLAGTPTHVECGFETIGYGSWIWSATSTQITITVANSGTYTFSWYAEYQP
jgi:hypothetical protein